MAAARIQVLLGSPMHLVLLSQLPKFICAIDPEASAQPVLVGIVTPVGNLAKRKYCCHRMNSILASYDVYVI